MKHLLLFGVISCCMSTVFGQGYPNYDIGLKIKLNEDGSKYIRFITWHQVWLKYNQNNDGSTLAGKPINESYDISLLSLIHI